MIRSFAIDVPVRTSHREFGYSRAKWRPQQLLAMLQDLLDRSFYRSEHEFMLESEAGAAGDIGTFIQKL
jgi:hypothetical protein